MGKLRSAIIATSLAFIATSAVPSFAQDVNKRSADAPDIVINNVDDCKSEGGSVVEGKDGDTCLVPMRPEEYQSEVYDGSQLGIIECPVDTINDGLYCLYPLSAADEEAESDKKEDKAATEE